MGCTPSIHVNQTGVVYCRDTDDLTSQHASQSATIISGTKVILTETTELSHSSSSGRINRQNNINLIDSSKETGINFSKVSNLIIMLSNHKCDVDLLECVYQNTHGRYQNASLNLSKYVRKISEFVMEAASKCTMDVMKTPLWGY